MSESLYGRADRRRAAARPTRYLDARDRAAGGGARRAHRAGGADPRRGAAARRRCSALALVARGTLAAARAARALAGRGAPSRSCSRRGRSATRRRSTRRCSSRPTASGVWVGANCHRPTTGRSSACGTSPATGRRPPGDEAQQSREYRRRGMQYLRDHAGRVPVVLAARVGRLFDVFRPAQMRVYEASEGRAGALGAPRRVACTGCSLPARHRRERGCCAGAASRWPSCSSPLAMVTLTALLTYGSTRFRFAAEPSLVVLAAVAVDAAPAAGAGARRERPAATSRARELRARIVRGRRSTPTVLGLVDAARPGAGADRHAPARPGGDRPLRRS